MLDVRDVRKVAVLAMCIAAGVAHTGHATPQQSPDCVAPGATGDHAYTCRGLRVDARIPASCPAAGCGLILQIHGDTGTGLLEDGHTELGRRGADAGFIVISPTGSSSGAAWSKADDARLFGIAQDFMTALKVDATRVHVTGFSRGGFVTWRFVCDHSDVFASAAPAGASDGSDRGETTCFTPGHTPSRKMPLLLLIGKTDAAVFYRLIAAIRDRAIADYGVKGPRVISSDAGYAHSQWTNANGALIEAFEHTYETRQPGPWDRARGHCFPGSTTDPLAPRYAFGCRPPTSFVWGEEVVKFFVAHPMR